MAYRVLTGMNYPPDQRAEVGDIVDDLPPKSVKWLLASGHIEEANAKPGKAPRPVEPEPEPESESQPTTDAVADDAPADPEDGE